MNISAANKLSALMNQYEVNQYEVNHCDSWDGSCEFQRIIASGIREAAANNQDDIQLKLSNFYINVSNIEDLHGIWSTNTSNAEYLFLTSPAHDEPTSHVEFNLSSCHKLRTLILWGDGILIRDTASSPTWEFPVWIVLNSSCPDQRAYPTPVLPCIQDIDLKLVKCSSTWLRSLFSTLLTLNHEVMCELDDCDITSCVEGSDTCTSATIRTGLNELVIRYGQKDSIGLWEAFCGLNIKSLSFDVQRREGLSSVDHAEFMSQCLSSLIQLETLSICVDKDSPGLWEALQGLNIKSLSLGVQWEGGLSVDHAELLSQCLSSLTQLDTLIICVDKDSPGLWEALQGLNIKSLSVSGTCSRGLSVNHAELMSQCLSSLTQLETFTIYVRTYIDMQLPQSLKYFNFYCHELHRSELRDHLNTMSVCTQSVEIRLEFGCTSCVHVKNTPQEEEYIDIQEKLKNFIVKRFRIYDRTPGSHIWSERDIGGVDEDDHHHDSVNNKMHGDFLRSLDYTIMNRMAMRLQIIPALIS